MNGVPEHSEFNLNSTGSPSTNSCAALGLLTTRAAIPKIAVVADTIRINRAFLRATLTAGSGPTKAEMTQKHAAG